MNNYWIVVIIVIVIAGTAITSQIFEKYVLLKDEIEPIIDAMPTPVNGQITDSTTMKTPGVYLDESDK